MYVLIQFSKELVKPSHDQQASCRLLSYQVLHFPHNLSCFHMPQFSPKFPRTLPPSFFSHLCHHTTDLGLLGLELHAS